MTVKRNALPARTTPDKCPDKCPPTIPSKVSAHTPQSALLIHQAPHQHTTYKAGQTVRTSPDGLSADTRTDTPASKGPVSGCPFVEEKSVRYAGRTTSPAADPRARAFSDGFERPCQAEFPP